MSDRQINYPQSVVSSETARDLVTWIQCTQDQRVSYSLEAAIAWFAGALMSLFIACTAESLWACYVGWAAFGISLMLSLVAAYDWHTWVSSPPEVEFQPLSGSDDEDYCEEQGIEGRAEEA